MCRNLGQAWNEELWWVTYSQHLFRMRISQIRYGLRWVKKSLTPPNEVLVFSRKPFWPRLKNTNELLCEGEGEHWLQYQDHDRHGFERRGINLGKLISLTVAKSLPDLWSEQFLQIKTLQAPRRVRVYADGIYDLFHQAPLSPIPL